MLTGLKPIDSMTAIGRGQRELIIGDRQTGKSQVAIDTIINNKDKDLICIYVAVGQRMSTVVAVAETLREHGALDNTVIAAAPADEAAPIKFMAPYAGRATGDQRRHLGVQSGGERSVEADEEGRRQAAPRPVAVPRAGGVRAVRVGARRGDAADPGAR